MEESRQRERVKKRKLNLRTRTTIVSGDDGGGSDDSETFIHLLFMPSFLICSPKHSTHATSKRTFQGCYHLHHTFECTHNTTVRKCQHACKFIQRPFSLAPCLLHSLVPSFRRYLRSPSICSVSRSRSLVAFLKCLSLAHARSLC